ncbi:hypothetical protein ATOP_01930 [Granulimonas faecalis]|uniref:Uncharacterized protein n=1 Tax=Granulimonas faecalis TaxID=2894155 RepID=A0AAV5B0W3_9ACTN|nr:hypothetical protein ATOP_01930 [Granulimonas faecalis]
MANVATSMQSRQAPKTGAVQVALDHSPRSVRPDPPGTALREEEEDHGAGRADAVGEAERRERVDFRRGELLDHRIGNLGPDHEQDGGESSGKRPHGTVLC